MSRINHKYTEVTIGTALVALFLWNQRSEISLKWSETEFVRILNEAEGPPKDWNLDTGSPDYIKNVKFWLEKTRLTKQQFTYMIYQVINGHHYHR